ncbi:universal stress protein [Amnibacterium sp. CER49]|uniref:universal stress protein n=1 Tax=Amnibacterium sp. CER49 TaxID=3039161 RepID=UPI002447E3CB|nr:universal stress protein [Amnibacterium sp. CER49]MDH2444481.1 universal stress protein [Amnibacterium sp. CER49]
MAEIPTPPQPHPTSQPVVVAGVLPDQPLWVLQVAGDFARQFGARLVIVTVDANRFAMQALADGTMIAAPLDPDTFSDEPDFPPEWLDQVGDLLDPISVPWEVRQLVGEPAGELMRVADEVDATLIVVGARHAGFRGALHNFFAGSVALRLAHRQYRPIVVVPIQPVAEGDRLPWEDRAGAEATADAAAGRHRARPAR